MKLTFSESQEFYNAGYAAGRRALAEELGALLDSMSDQGDRGVTGLPYDIEDDYEPAPTSTDPVIQAALRVAHPDASPSEVEWIAQEIRDGER